MSDELRRRIETEAIHAGEIHDAFGAHIAPIYQTSTYTFENMQAIEEWAAGETAAYIYARGGNPAWPTNSPRSKVSGSRPPPPRYSPRVWPQSVRR